MSCALLQHGGLHYQEALGGCTCHPCLASAQQILHAHSTQSVWSNTDDFLQALRSLITKNLTAYQCDHAHCWYWAKACQCCTHSVKGLHRSDEQRQQQQQQPEQQHRTLQQGMRGTQGVCVLAAWQHGVAGKQAAAACSSVTQRCAQP